ncbi:MAG: ATP-binding protein [Pseudomonadota bacterium]
MAWLPFELDPTTSHSPVAERIRIRQALDLVKQLPIMLGGNLSLSSLTALALWGTVSPAHMFMWLALFWIAAIPGLRHWLKYRHAPEPERVSVQLIWRASVFSLFVAAPWGLGNWFFFDPTRNETELIIIFVTGGLTAGVVSALATVPTICLVFVVATVLPLLLRLFMVGGVGHGVMASMLVIYVGFLSVFVRNSYRRMKRDVEAGIEKQNMQKKLEDAHRRLSQAMTRTSEEILLFDGNECLVMDNAKWADSSLFPNVQLSRGASLVSLIGASVKAGLVPAAMRREQAWVEEFLAWYRTAENDFIVETKDARTCRLSTQPTDDGDRFLVLADVTQLHAESAKAKLNAQRLKDFAESAADWMWELDAERKFSLVSPNNVSSSAIMDLAGQNLRALQKILPSQAAWKEIEHKLSAKAPFRDLRFQIEYNGKATNFSAGGKPVYDENGRFQGHRGTVRDITSEVQAENQLKEAKERAEESSRSKSDFLAHMSHELRTPLNAILGFSEMMSLGLHGKIEQPEYLDYVETIHESGAHLLAVINDILEISQIESGKAQIRETDIDVTALFESCRRLIEGRAADVGHVVVTHVPVQMPVLCADERHIKQILMNLLGNAVKFTPSGGRISLAAEVTAQQTIRFLVSDNGPGMSDADQARVLIPFDRGSALTRGDAQGCGLGLPLSRMLTELHGGQLHLASEVGKGTAITVEFPPYRTVTRPTAARN